MLKILLHSKLDLQIYSIEIKGKAVPLHAMEALGGGRGGIAPTHSRPRH
jgi:hypothetical protein